MTARVPLLLLAFAASAFGQTEPFTHLRFDLGAQGGVGTGTIPLWEVDREIVVGEVGLYAKGGVDVGRVGLSAEVAAGLLTAIYGRAAVLVDLHLGDRVTVSGGVTYADIYANWAGGEAAYAGGTGRVEFRLHDRPHPNAPIGLMNDPCWWASSLTSPSPSALAAPTATRSSPPSGGGSFDHASSRTSPTQMRDAEAHSSLRASAMTPSLISTVHGRQHTGQSST